MIADRLDKQALGEIEMSDASRDIAKFLFGHIIAKAEAPRQIDVNLRLSDLIKQSIDGA